MTTQNPTSIFTAFFLALIALNLVIKFWLGTRQFRCVLKNRQQVPVAFSAQITLPQHQKAANYTIAKLKLNFFELGFEIVLLLIWTLGGALALLNQTLLFWLPTGLVQQLVLVALFCIINTILQAPLNLYVTFGIEQKFGFNTSTSKLWATDQIKTICLSAIIGLPLLALVLWVMQSTGGGWWLIAWLILIAFNLLAMIVYPTWIAPLFNKFQPLEDAAIQEKSSALMKRCGFRPKGFFVMDGSRRSSHGNAYFTGLGPAKRVVFFDTLLKNLTPLEIEAILAHELGHFKRKHLIKTIALMFLISLIAFYALSFLSTKQWFYQGLGVPFSEHEQGMALILFMLTIPLITIFFTSLFSQFSRRHEFEADAYAAKMSSSTALSDSLIKLYRDNASTLTPDPLYAEFYYSHPTAAERIKYLKEPPT